MWAKVGTYPWWPAKTLDPARDLSYPPDADPPRPTSIPIRFFGTFDFCWIGSKRAMADWEQVRGCVRGRGCGVRIFGVVVVCRGRDPGLSVFVCAKRGMAGLPAARRLCTSGPALPAATCCPPACLALTQGFDQFSLECDQESFAAALAEVEKYRTTGEEGTIPWGYCITGVLQHG